MKIFWLTVACAFVAVLAMALVVNFCRRRLGRSPHGLTGMCHRDGGAICSSCPDGEETKPSGSDRLSSHDS